MSKVTLNAASGTFDASTDNVNVDGVSTTQVQYMKLADGTIGGTTVVKADANGLYVAAGSPVAHAASDSGNPVKVGGIARSSLSAQTPVTDAQRTNAMFDLDGALVVRNDSPIGDKVDNSIDTTTNTSTQLLAAQGSGIHTVLTKVTLVNTSTNNTYVDILDGATRRWRLPCPALGGCTQEFHLHGAANTAWNIQAGTASTTISVSGAGFKTKV